MAKRRPDRLPPARADLVPTPDAIDNLGDVLSTKIDSMRNELRAEIHCSIQETRRQAEESRRQMEQIRRHFDLIAQGLPSQLQLILGLLNDGVTAARR